jgi:paired amphipathic helix protein Sin3a
MKSLLLLSTFTLSAVVSSQLIVPLIHRGGRGFAGPAIPPGLKLDRDQAQAPLMDPLAPGPAIPPSPGNGRDEEPVAGGPGSVMLSDVMGRDRSINIFAGFTRDIESVSNRLDDGAKNSTVLAPLNSAIEKLPRKPWEDPRDYGALGPQAYEGEDGQERAQRNLRRFVEAHIVPTSPWKEGQRVKPLGDDREVWWEEKDGKRVVKPGDIEVVSVASTVANGEVVSFLSLHVLLLTWAVADAVQWILRGARNY